MKPLVAITVVVLLACSTSRYAGSTFETAIVVQETTKERALAYEQHTIAERYPHHTIIGRKQEKKDDKLYDIFFLRMDNTQQVIIFDITRYFNGL